MPPTAQPSLPTHPSAELFTLRDYLRFAVSRFIKAGLYYGHGCSNAWDEAVFLSLHTLSLPPDQLEPFLDARLIPAEREALLHIYQRRIEERQPAAYLTHKAFLGGFGFYVDERVIVPRSFIAELLNEQFSPWVSDLEEPRRILDLCTGSGCLAILAALNFPEAQVDAIDISPEALEVACRNIHDYQLEGRVRLIQSDAFDALADETYDIILSNPPYVDALAMSTLPLEYQKEPRLALESGLDGLDFTHRILMKAPYRLNPNGLLVVEIGHNRQALEAAYPSLPFTWPETRAGDGYVFMLRREEIF